MRFAKDWPQTPTTGTCCESSAYFGAEACVCWEPVFDLEQVEPIAGLKAGLTGSMCSDCAFRPNSPERQRDADAAGDPEYLAGLVADGVPFWCHQGIRRPRVWRHPSGVEVPGSPFDYMPPGVNGVPYKADGTPADLCSGWAAHRLKHVDRATRAARDGS